LTVFQEGYTSGFGADADHLKTTDDIDRYARVGFTMFTFDPSVFVVNEAISLPMEELLQRAKNIETNNLHLSECIERYAEKSFRLDAEEYRLHAGIAKMIGQYKISIKKYYRCN
jgi:hypothetical protein